MPRILLLEDDPELATWMETGLEDYGYTVDHFSSGSHALAAATQDDYDLLVLDRMVPDIDGLKVLKTLRAMDDSTPVLLVTALSGSNERAEGFENGCDDYMVKPFAFSELAARVGLLLERSSGKEPTVVGTRLTAADLTIDLLSRECHRQEQRIRLTSTEFKLLDYLMRNPKRLITRTMLLEKVWGLNFDPTTSVVETHISRLRSKIDNPYEHKLIETLRGDGYVFDP
ncbi:MAG: response regulator transcription factor [Halieaceae bacterium]